MPSRSDPKPVPDPNELVQVWHDGITVPAYVSRESLEQHWAALGWSTTENKE